MDKEEMIQPEAFAELIRMFITRLDNVNDSLDTISNSLYTMALFSYISTLEDKEFADKFAYTVCKNFLDLESSMNKEIIKSLKKELRRKQKKYGYK